MACITLDIFVTDCVLLGIAAAYTVTFFLIITAFIRKSPAPDYPEHPGIKISVIIAARNEDNNLPALLGDLKMQKYNKDLYDVIVVDDHSDRKISSLPEIKDLKLGNLLIIDLPGDKMGKKEALRIGAERSESDLLLFTDADCRVGPNWVMSFAGHYFREHPGIVIGMVKYPEGTGLFKTFVRYDFISMVISGIGTASLGIPTICNGANLAVGRRHFMELITRVPQSNPSGDDVFLLHEAKRARIKISTLKDREALVTTGPPHTLREFFNQRARWASKASLYKDISTISLSMLVVITNILFVIGIVEAATKGLSTIWGLLLFTKIITDYGVILVGTSYFREKRSLIWLPVVQILYPAYLIISILMASSKFYRWKGRKY